MFPVSITLHNPAQLNAVLAALGTNIAAPEVERTAAPVADKQDTKKEVKQQTKKDAAPASEPTPTASDNSASSSTESNAADANEKAGNTEQSMAPTYEDAKTAVLKLGKAKGRQATLDVLSRFGATKLPDVQPEAFADLIALVEGVIAGGEV